MIFPPGCAVVPVGAPGCGKTTLLSRVAAARDDPGFRFGADDVRLLAFGTRAYLGAGHLVHGCAQWFFAARLASGRSAAYDATNTTPADRRSLLGIANHHRALPVALVFRTPRHEILERNRGRARDAVVPHEVVLRYQARVEALTGAALLEEGFDLAVDLVVDGGTVMPSAVLLRPGVSRRHAALVVHALDHAGAGA